MEDQKRYGKTFFSPRRPEWRELLEMYQATGKLSLLPRPPPGLEMGENYHYRMRRTKRQTLGNYRVSLHWGSRLRGTSVLLGTFSAEDDDPVTVYQDSIKTNMRQADNKSPIGKLIRCRDGREVVVCECDQGLPYPVEVEVYQAMSGGPVKP